MNNNIFKQIFIQAKKRKRRIGICILKKDKKLITSLKKAQKYVNIIIYGIEIQGFETVVLTPKKSGLQMVKDFRNGKIDQFVRGQADDLSTLEEYKRQFNLNSKIKRFNPCLIEDNFGWQFFLASASNPEALNLKDKLRIINNLITWITKNIKLKPKVAVMATCRPMSYGKNKKMDKIYNEAEYIVRFLKRKKIQAKNINIEIEKAKDWDANIILPASGPIGNQIFRSLLYLGGGKLYFCPTVLSKKHFYEDNSRNEINYFNHLIFAQSLANHDI